MHVFLFSDHVSAADEVELKRRGAARGLLVMGPGCGTAMLGEVGLGFANVVRAGTVGIVAAAGTGAQEAAILLDGAGVGVSQIIGVGGRDLSAEVGGIMFGEAMRMLADDDETETLLLVSKPPARSAVEKLGAVDVGGKRVVAAFVGWDGGDAPFEVHPTLDAGAFAAAGAAVPEFDAEVAGRGRLLGLFSGGSLAHEAVTVLRPRLGAIGGNAGDGSGDGHAVYDLGEEEYTQGRPHPMVDLEVRRRMLEQAGDDVGCVLLDVVIGHGSHADPAGGLAPALRRLARDRPVIAHVCGTAGDPQDADRQAATLRDAGVIVAPTNAAAARLAGKAVAA
jgi:FdrA protein